MYMYYVDRKWYAVLCGLTKDQRDKWVYARVRMLNTFLNVAGYIRYETSIF